MRSGLKRLFETVLGLWALFVLLCHSRFRLRGQYWQWRWQTAFGRGEPAFFEKAVSLLDYARWMHQMRRHRR